MATFYASPAEVVDGQEWRVVVRDSAVIAGERALDYDFRNLGEEQWRSQAHWREATPPAGARALFNRYRRPLILELMPARFPAMPGV